MSGVIQVNPCPGRLREGGPAIGAFDEAKPLAGSCQVLSTPLDHIVCVEQFLCEDLTPRETRSCVLSALGQYSIVFVSF